EFAFTDLYARPTVNHFGTSDPKLVTIALFQNNLGCECPVTSCCCAIPDARPYRALIAARSGFIEKFFVVLPKIYFAGQRIICLARWRISKNFECQNTLYCLYFFGLTYPTVRWLCLRPNHDHIKRRGS